jgi:hypothetical protein
LQPPAGLHAATARVQCWNCVSDCAYSNASMPLACPCPSMPGDCRSALSLGNLPPDGVQHWLLPLLPLPSPHPVHQWPCHVLPVQLPHSPVLLPLRPWLKPAVPAALRLQTGTSQAHHLCSKTAPCHPSEQGAELMPVQLHRTLL